MYVYIYIYIYIYIYACMHRYIHTYTCIHIYTHTHLRTDTYIQTHMRIKPPSILKDKRWKPREMSSLDPEENPTPHSFTITLPLYWCAL